VIPSLAFVAQAAIGLPEAFPRMIHSFLLQSSGYWLIIFDGSVIID
jgi:hypothetical protein